MARTNKIGIDYFPFDVDFFQDDKIQLIEAEFGIKGGYIAIRLLCKIYREGYFYRWGVDECLLFTKNCGIEGVTRDIVDEVVNGLVKRGFFNETAFNSFSILTSVGIQRRYFEATKRYKTVEVIKEYLLVDVSKLDNVNIISINADINPNNDNTNPQRKEKGKEIEKEKKREGKKEPAKRLSPPSLTEVSEYITKQGYSVSAARFIAYYESNGWRVGRNPMKDWQAAVRSWQQREQADTAKNQTPAGVTLGVDERMDNGRRTFGTGKITVPMDAPPRPGGGYAWDAASQNWICL